MIGPKKPTEPQIYAIKTTIGQEKVVVDFMMKSIIKESLKALLLPETLRGYIFIETQEPQLINNELLKIPNVRARLVGQVEMPELE